MQFDQRLYGYHSQSTTVVVFEHRFPVDLTDIHIVNFVALRVFLIFENRIRRMKKELKLKLLIIDLI